MRFNDLTAIVAFILASISVIVLLVKVTRSLGKAVALADIVAEEFSRDHDGGSLPDRLARIEADVSRISDAITFLAYRTREDQEVINRNIMRLESKINGGRG